MDCIVHRVTKSQTLLSDFHFTSLEGPICLHRTIQLQLLQYCWAGHRLDYCDSEWFALETNRDCSVTFETASKYCISDSLVDYDGYSISSKVLLPTVVDKMVSSV